MKQKHTDLSFIQRPAFIRAQNNVC